MESYLSGSAEVLSMSPVMIHCLVSHHKTTFSSTLSIIHPHEEKSLHGVANKWTAFVQSWPRRNSSPPSQTLDIQEIRMPRDLFHIEKFKIIPIN